MTDKEVMQIALDIMESAIKAGDWIVDGACDPDFVLNALRAALAQPERAECDGGQCGIGGYCKQCPKTQLEPEPVAFVVYDSESNDIVWAEAGMHLKQNTPLYAAPLQREWVGLTHEECMEILTRSITAPSRIEVAEALLKEKNSG